MRVEPSRYRLSISSPPFIAFEGINGCGKTTLFRSISERLQTAGYPVCGTREPGGTPLGLELRKLLLEWSGEKKSDRAELLLFAADRAEHVDKVIRPALSAGKWVLCDRFLHSTITFQGHGRGIRRDWIDRANELAVQDTLPNLVILLDLEPAQALKRVAARIGNGRDAFEDEQLSFHTRIRDGFLECAETSPIPFLVLDATKTPDELVAITSAALGL